MQLFDALELPQTAGWIEIFVLSAIFYSIFRLFKGTRGISILMGLLLVYGALYAITTLGHLTTLNWLLSRLMLYLSLAFVVIFQPEIRHILARLGRKPIWSSNNMVSQKSLIIPLMQTVKSLSKQHIGALIAIERDIGMRAFSETGTRINGIVSSELLRTLFVPKAPLHDGAVIISDNRIRAAGCIFPLTQNQEISKTLGTRHRAAIGITEETDAIVLVVSEESGEISLAYNGRLKQNLTDDQLQRILTSMLRREHTGLDRFRKKLKSGDADLSKTSLMTFKDEQNEN